MHISRVVPLLLSVFLILLFAWVALGFVFSDHCPFAFCKSTVVAPIEKSGDVLLKYVRNQNEYHVLGLIEVPSTCTDIYTTVTGSASDPLTIYLSRIEPESVCASEKVPRTFYVVAPGSADQIRVSVDGKERRASAVEVQSLSDLTF